MDVDTATWSFETAAKTNPDVYRILKPKIEPMANNIKRVIGESIELLENNAGYPVAFIYIIANTLAKTIPNLKSDVTFEKMLAKARHAVKPEDLPKLESMADEIVNTTGGRKLKGGAIGELCALMIGLMSAFGRTSTNYFGDYSYPVEATLVAVSLACVGYGIYRGTQNLAQAMNADFAAAQEINQEVEPDNFIPKGNASSPTIDIGKDKADPITLNDFEDGQIVIIHKNNTQAPISRDGLLDWFNQAKRAGHPSYIWPSTNQAVTSSDELQARRVRIIKGGRRTKKVRKARKTKTRKTVFKF